MKKFYNNENKAEGSIKTTALIDIIKFLSDNQLAYFMNFIKAD